MNLSSNLELLLNVKFEPIEEEEEEEEAVPI